MEVLQGVFIGFVGAVLGLALKQVLTLALLNSAVRTEAKGARKQIGALEPGMRNAVTAAHALRDTILDGKTADFALVTALPAGWVVTPPRVEVVGYSERLDATQAYAISTYIDRWNQFSEYERRYRANLESLLDSLENRPETPIKVKELAVRVCSDAEQIHLAALKLTALSTKFAQGDISCLSEAETERVYASADRANTGAS